MKNVITLLSLAFCLLMTNTTFAVVAPISASTTTEVAAEEVPTLSKKEMRKQAKLQKKLAKLEKKMAEGPFDDDIDKWRNMWLLSWGLAVVLSVLAFVGTIGLNSGIVLFSGVLGSLLWTFGFVALIIWLIKMFA